MLILSKGVNQIYVTISELNTINNALYKLVILDEMKQITTTIDVLDTSIYAERYNQFEVTVVDNIAAQDLSNGIAYLEDGKHTYTIIAYTGIGIMPYQEDICEIGMCKVLKSSDAPGTEYPATTQYISYTGNISQNI